MVFDVAAGGAIVVRTLRSGALQCDVPRTCLEGPVEVLRGPRLLRLATTGNHRFALHFADERVFDAAVAAVERARLETVYTMPSASSNTQPGGSGHVIRDKQLSVSPLPDLADPVVREFLVRLLFSDQFAEFTADLQTACDSMAAALPAPSKTDGRR
jgi:hypothetical protein